MFNRSLISALAISFTISAPIWGQEIVGDNPAIVACPLDSSGDPKEQLRRQGECLALFKRNQADRAQLIQKELEIISAERRKLEQENKVLAEKTRQLEMQDRLAQRPAERPEIPALIEQAQTIQKPWSDNPVEMPENDREPVVEVDSSSLPTIWALRETLKGDWTAILILSDGSMIKVNPGSVLPDGYIITEINRQGVTVKHEDMARSIALSMGN